MRGRRRNSGRVFGRRVRAVGSFVVYAASREYSAGASKGSGEEIGAGTSWGELGRAGTSRRWRPCTGAGAAQLLGRWASCFSAA